MSVPHAKHEAPPLARFADAVGSDGHVQIDVPCRRCGYNLRTIARREKCPECEFPVSLSLRSGDLAYSEPRYVSRLSLGAHFILIGPLITLASFFLSPSIVRGMGIVHIAAFACVAAGGWLITAPDPAGLESSSPRLRLLTRGLLITGLMAYPLHIWSLWTVSPPVFEIAAFLCRTCCLIAFVGVLALVRHMGAMGHRMGSYTVMSQTRMALRGLTLTVPPLVVLYWFRMSVGVISPAKALPLAIVGMVAGMGFLVTLFAGIGAAWTLARELNRETKLAKQLWPTDRSNRILPARFE